MPDPAAPVAATNVVETAAGYWWCSECRCEVSPQLVTYSEHHESCGHPVTWIEPAEASEIARLRAEVAELRKGTVPMVVQGEELNGAMLEQLDAMKADLNPLMEANNTMAARIAELEAEVTALSKDATFAATANRADRDIVDECRRLQAFHAGKGHYLATQWCMRDAAAEIERLREEVAELRTSVVAFGAPWAASYAHDHGAPSGALHHRHYDILAAAGARMVNFTRWVPDDER